MPSPFQEYSVGETLSLTTLPCKGDLTSPTIQVRIREVRTPSVACAMVVDVDGSPVRAAFLKLHDRRYNKAARRDNEIYPWVPQFEEAYIRSVQTGAVHQFLHKLHHDEDFRTETGDDWDDWECEAFLADECHQDFLYEATAYDALREHQGKAIQRLLAAVDLNLTPPGVEDHELFHAKGLLLEYIDGFDLSNLPDHAPRSVWQAIVDDAIAAVHLLGDHNILDEDRHLKNFIISPKPDGKFQVFMIDFGCRKFKGKDESDRAWGKAKLTENEEGAIGAVMKKKLAMVGFDLRYERSSRYLEWAGGNDSDSDGWTERPRLLKHHL